jgi:hypothetical protein
MGNAKARARCGIAAFLLVSWCADAFAQGSATPAGTYFHDLGKMMSQIRGIDWTVDICAEKYPATETSNRQAAQRWKSEHKRFLDEMNSAFQGLPAYWSNHDPRSAKAAPELWAKINKQLDSGRDLLAHQYFAQLGQEEFSTICANFPAALHSHQFDFETFYPNEVATIRRGPP